MKYFFLLAAVLAAIYSDQLDKQFSGNGKLRKVILVFCVAVLVITLVPVIIEFL